MKRTHRSPGTQLTNIITIYIFQPSLISQVKHCGMPYENDISESNCDVVGSWEEDEDGDDYTYQF